MANRFPHLNDSNYPDVENVNVYQWENTLDYSKYDTSQMKITVCSVPWDVGLIHVGNAQIGGLGNVVYFENKNARDSYIDSIENKYSWETKYRAYHTGGYIEVPLPYEKAVLYNYVVCEYMRLPVNYSEGGKDKFFFFIRECEYLSPSATRVKLLRDTWQTFIYDVNIKNMMLERGHAPQSIVDADAYLSNPQENNSYLLANDVNFGNSYISKYQSSIVLNEKNIKAVIISTSNPQDNFGIKTDNSWYTPNGNNYLSGTISHYAFALNPEKLSTFFENIKANTPQFIQTIKGVFFISNDFITLGASFTFGGQSCYLVEQKTSNLNLLNLTKNQFNFGTKYENLAKLYTYPYSYLEVIDDNGNVSQLKIEETSGNISLTVSSSLIYPFINIDGRLNGIGLGQNNIIFRNVNEHSFSFGGNWYDYLYNWKIASFAVTISAAEEYDYKTHFNRKQLASENENIQTNSIANATTSKADADANATVARENANASALQTQTAAINSATTARINAKASADTAKVNADNSADTEKTNADNSADTAYNNNVAIAATSQNNANANADTSHDNAIRDANGARNRFTMERNLASAQVDLMTSTGGYIGHAGYIGAASWENISKISDDWTQDFRMQYAVTEISNYGSSQAAVINGVGNAAASIGSAAVGGLVAGPEGAAVGAITGLASSAIGLASASASIPIQIGVTEDMRDVTLAAGNAKTNNAISYLKNMETHQRNLEISKYNNDNTWLTNIANLIQSVNTNDANDLQTTAKANAKRNYDVDTANAARTRDTSKLNATNSKNTSNTNSQNDKDITYSNADNTFNTAKTNADNAYNTAIANATRSYNTAIANNERDYNNSVDVANRNKAIADSAIENAIKQAALNAPITYGDVANAETATTRPQGLFCNIVTQSQDAIEQTGDYFLRYGYAVNRAWTFNGFNLMPKFTYWKCSDIWISSNNVPDAYLDEIRFYLLGGVCVWNDPNDIGNISIYDNKE